MTATPTASRPHVLLLNRWYEPEVFGGTETSLSGLAAALSDAGAAVSVICETRSLPIGTSSQGPLRVHRYAVSKPPIRLWFMAATTNYQHIVRNLRVLASSVPHQHVIARMPEFAAAAASAMPEARVTYWSPGGGAGWFGLFQGRGELTSRERFWNRIDTWQNTAIYRRAARRSHLVVAETEGVKAEIVRRCGVSEDKVTVRRNGVDLVKFCPAPRDPSLLESLGVPIGAPVVTGVARLEPMKNFSFLLRGFAAMNRSSAYLIIVGDGALRADLEALSTTLGIAERVRFVGWRHDVHRFLAAASAFVLPSVYEPYGNAFTEALASGVPSIGLRNGAGVASAAADHITDGLNGFLLDADDVSGLGNRLDSLTEDGTRWRQMSATTRRMAVERYDWEPVAAQFLKDFGITMPPTRASQAIA